MSKIMLQKLAEFFKDKNISMECHEYCAHIDAPCTRKEIRKEFKTFKAMLVKLKKHMSTIEPEVVIKPKATIKTKVKVGKGTK